MIARVCCCKCGATGKFDVGPGIATIEQAPTDEEWLERMRVDRDLWTTEQLRETEIHIEAFAFGLPIATVRGRDFALEMTTSPEGHRHYWAAKGAYERALAEDEVSRDSRSGRHRGPARREDPPTHSTPPSPGHECRSLSSRGDDQHADTHP